MSDLSATHVSDRLFGRRCRLPVMIWVLRRDPARFFQSEVPLFGASRSNVNQELDRLIELGMLSKERPPGSNRLYYDRIGSRLWDVIDAAADVVDLSDPDDDAEPDDDESSEGST